MGCTDLKKNTMMVILLAISLIAVSSGLTVIAIMSDENRKLNRVEQIVLADSNDSNANPQYTMDESNTEESMGKKNEGAVLSDGSSVKNHPTEGETSVINQTKEIQVNYNITVKEGTDDSDCNISYKQAVSLGVEAIKKETGLSLSYADVNVSRYNTNESVIWNCVAEDGKYRFEFRVNANSGKFLSYRQYELEKGSDYVWVSKSNEGVAEKKIDQQNIQAYKSIIIRAGNNMNIEIKEGAFYSINAKYYGAYQVDYKIENGVMKIDTEGYSDTAEGVSSTLTLTIPEDAVIENVKVRLDYGNFTMEKVPTNSIDVYMDCGTLTMNQVTSGDSTLNIGSGDAELTDYKSNKSSIRIASGELHMINCSSEVCKITMDMGEASLKGELLGRTDFTSALGSIEIQCTKAEKNYNYTVETDMGIVSVNGVESLTKLSTNNKAANSINVSTGMGNAILDFEAKAILD